MLKTLALTLTLLLSFTVAACGSTSGTSAKIDQTTANAVQTAPTDAVQRVRLTIANQDELIVKLNGTRVLLIMRLGVIWQFFTVITVMPTASLNLVLLKAVLKNWLPSIMISLLNWNACPKKTELAQCKLCFFRLSAFPSISQRSLLYSELYNRPQE